MLNVFLLLTLTNVPVFIIIGDIDYMIPYHSQEIKYIQVKDLCCHALKGYRRLYSVAYFHELSNCESTY